MTSRRGPRNHSHMAYTLCIWTSIHSIGRRGDHIAIIFIATSLSRRTWPDFMMAPYPPLCCIKHGTMQSALTDNDHRHRFMQLAHFVPFVPLIVRHPFSAARDITLCSQPFCSTMTIGIVSVWLSLFVPLVYPSESFERCFFTLHLPFCCWNMALCSRLC